MATILKFRRFTTNDSAFIGSNGELTVDTDLKTLRLHDGQLTGGTIIATRDYVTAYASATYDTSSTVTSKINTALSSYDTTSTVNGKLVTTLATVDTKISTALGSYDTTSTVNGKLVTTLATVDTKIATALTSYDTSAGVTTKINTAISDVVGSAPAALNTLKELGDALGNDANYASTITTSLSLKAPLASPALTGTPTAPTATASTRTTQIATTAYVQTNLDDYAKSASPALTGVPTAPTAATTVNDTQIATTAFVQSLIDQALKAAFPTGIITVWKGTVATIPTGYHLCDGTNGTPDLRDKFVVGAGGSYTPGDTGGSDSKTLTNSELPSHDHTATIANNGAHEHFVANVDTAIGGQNLIATNTMADTGNLGTSSSYNLGGSATAATIGLTSTAGTHNHTIDIDSTGDGLPFDIRPPYYALCYIMKSWA
jgi:microcystin-dependent protein